MPPPTNSPCLRLGMRSERGSNWNKTITFPPNSWAIRQEHWSEWKAHKMCIADCLQCSLGLVWRQERSHEPCRSMCMCICADGGVLSPLAFTHIWKHRIIEINKSAHSHQKGKKGMCSQTAARDTRQKSGWHTVLYLVLFLPLTFSVMLRLQCPRVPDSRSHRDMFGLHKADDY